MDSSGQEKYDQEGENQVNLYMLLGMLESNQFKCLEDFSVFAGEFLAFVGQGGMQADIVSKNESKYHFF